MKFFLLITLALGLLVSGVRAADSPQARAEQLLRIVNASYQALYKVSSEAQWLASTDVSPEHNVAAFRLPGGRRPGSFEP